MDRVLLLNRHQITLTLKPKENGSWVNGVYVEKNEPSKSVRGTLLPISKDTLKNYPQGAISVRDREFFTKEKLDEGDILIRNSEEWKVVEPTDFDVIADIKIDILKRSTKDG